MSRLPTGVPRPQAFVDEAPGKAGRTTYPWQRAGIRADVSVQVNVKLPEPLMLAVGHLAYQEGLTKREIIEAALQEWMQREAQARGLPPWPTPKPRQR
ncbi:hypothetical protein UFOVP326_113 [uncultured Caudovirales phage]|uniref:Uncharacterized protein n=1 Tax=uncultured Caudovirales phage TaxID=2100421 RepID=A0A6J5LTU7_9CAUD|nr:hypothetical protein UFOVP326_113 [uncultured Caudovirales phage]